MKQTLLLMITSALLALSGYAQTPAAGSNADQASIKGCLGGSDGNYTVAEDGTNQTLKITTSSVDLKLHLGQDVSLVGQKTNGSASSGAADNAFAVTGLTVISEHCAATTAAPAASAVAPSTTVGPTPGTTVIAPATAAAASASAASTPGAAVTPSSATASIPTADAGVPAATASPSPAIANTPAVDTAIPAATVSPSSATASTPAVDAAVPTATSNPSSTTASAPTVDAAVPAVNTTHATRPSARPRARSATPTAAATVPAETARPTAGAAATSAPSGPPSETAGTPVAAAAIPTATHKGGSPWLMILLVVLVIALTTLAPFLVRWRKRKMLERTDAPNLSLTHKVTSDEASPDHDKPEPRKAA